MQPSAEFDDSICSWLMQPGCAGRVDFSCGKQLFQLMLLAHANFAEVCPAIEYLFISVIYAAVQR
jgi:hypothetical protein